MRFTDAHNNLCHHFGLCRRLIGSLSVWQRKKDEKKTRNINYDVSVHRIAAHIPSNSLTMFVVWNVNLKPVHWSLSALCSHFGWWNLFRKFQAKHFFDWIDTQRTQRKKNMSNFLMKSTDTGEGKAAHYFSFVFTVQSRVVSIRFVALFTLVTSLKTVDAKRLESIVDFPKWVFVARIHSSLRLLAHAAPLFIFASRSVQPYKTQSMNIIVNSQ